MHSTVSQLICIWAGFGAHGVWLDEGDGQGRSKIPNRKLKFSDAWVSLWCFNFPEVTRFWQCLTIFLRPVDLNQPFLQPVCDILFFLCWFFSGLFCLSETPFVYQLFPEHDKHPAKQIARIPFSKRNHNPIIAFSWGKIILAAVSQRV